MTVTTSYEKSSADGWFLVANGATDCLVQIVSNGTLEIVAAAILPGPNTGISGVVLSKPSGDVSLALGSLDVAEKVFVKVSGTTTGFTVIQNGVAL